MRQARPSVNTMPAALDAMTDENGLMVEKVVPTELERKIAPTVTMES